MNYLSNSLVTVLCLMVFAVVFIPYTGAYLPDQVATHFDLHNQPDGWMARSDYLILALLSITIVPALISLVIALLPHKFPHLLNIPNRDYWLSLERREQSAHYLASHGCRLGCMVIMMMTGLHYALLVANSSRPAALPHAFIFLLLGGFLLALVIWVVALYRRFPRVKQP
jgi:uncharacterized membrane protein